MPVSFFSMSLKSSARIVFGGMTAFLLGSCAAAPDTIPEKFVGKEYYEDWSCRDLNEESAEIKDLVSSDYMAQDKARTNDKISLALLGVPLASLEGNDRTNEIGLLKGIMHALQEQRTAKNCQEAASMTDLSDSP